jgi:NADH dehydrogenase (ubiquinone) Fe-S protein 1
MLKKIPKSLKLDIDTYIFINEKKIFIENWKHISILQFCEFVGITIPKFCFHDKLSVAGNCRMCMVELKNSFKPVIACSTTLLKKMNIYINSYLVKHARENVLEFLLINHPLDCPICDQASECDLQDQTVSFGSDRGRFIEIKRSVEDLFMGPVVKTIMTRCIHCTRCVRFSKEVVGNFFLGTLGRGNITEIGSFNKYPFIDELSGNIVDLCPVGALTSKSYAFRARAWELKSIESIDIFDSLGSNIRIDVKGNEVMRILPKRNDNLNEEWITDKIRFSYEGLKKNRIIYPMLRKNKNEPLLIVSYSLFFFSLIEELLKDSNNKYYVELSNYFTSAVDFFIINNFFSFLGINNIVFNSLINNFNIDFRSNYLFNEHLNELEKGKSFLLNNINLKKENPVLNSRIKKLKVNNGTKVNISYIGSNINLNYDFIHLSNNSNNIFKILEGKHFYSSFINSTKIINGINSYLDNSVFSNLYFLNNLNIKNSFVLPTSSLVTLFDFGYQNYSINYKKNNLKNNILYLYNIENKKKEFEESKVIIYHGTNINEELKKISHYILPSTSFFEENLLFTNLLGYSQNTNIAVSTLPTQFFSINELFLNLNNELFKLLTKIKTNNNIFSIIKSSITSNNLNILFFNKIYPYSKVNYYFNNFKFETNYKQNIYNKYSINSEFMEDYYKVNNIILNSETLQKSSILINSNKSNFFKNLRVYEYIL